MNDSTIKAHIIKEVCGYFNVSEFDLMQKSHARMYVIPRQFIYYFTRNYTNMSLDAIGRIFLQDHSNVIHAVNTISDLIQYNGYSLKAKEIRTRIQNVIRTGTGAKRRSYHYKAMRRRSSRLFRKYIN